MLILDSLSVVSLNEFYQEVIFNPMKAKWLQDNNLVENDETSYKYFQQETFQALSDLVENEFDFGHNKDMLHYFSKEAILDEIDNKTRTFFVQSSDYPNDLLGAFSLAMKVVKIEHLSNSQKKRMLTRSKRSAAKYISEIPVILIAQVGKNYKSSQILDGKMLMSLVIRQIHIARKILGGQIIVLDSVNEQKVIQFYKDFGFVEYGHPIIDDRDETLYQPMAMDLSKNIRIE